MSELGSIIKERRSFLSLSLSRVAEAAQMTKTHVWQLEQGKAINPGTLTLVRLAVALGVDGQELFSCAAEDCRNRYSILASSVKA